MRRTRQTPETPKTPEYQKSQRWFEDVQSELTKTAQLRSDTGYIAVMGLEDRPEDDELPMASIRPRDERFLNLLHNGLNGQDGLSRREQIKFAELQDRRETIVAENGIDPIIEQYETLRIVLDDARYYH